MNYKNTETGEVISSTCYNRLPTPKQNLYVSTVEDEATHEVRYDTTEGDTIGEEDRFVIAALAIESITDFGADSNTSSNDQSGSVEFSGGDFGGGGASGDY